MNNFTLYSLTKNPVLKKLLLLLLLPFSVFAQKDTTFWFAAPDVNQFLPGNPHDRPILLRLTSFSSPSTVTISIPANPSFTPLTNTIAANSSGIVDLSAWADQIENASANTVANKGILIRATADITVYYEIVSNCNCNPELFSLKGRNSLGTEFIIPSQTEWAIDSVRFPQAKAAFDILATEDNTVINITPSKHLIGRLPGVPFSVSLNKGQTFSNQGLYRSGISLLNGSIVTSSKPIAVTTYEDLLMADGPCADLAGDQLIPTSIWGNEFVVVKGDLTNKDKVVITAMTDGTTIYLNGNATPSATINRGNSYEFNLSSQPVSYITSNYKISVYHYTGVNCEIGSAVIPKINCTGSNDVAITRSISEDAVVFITTRAGNQAGFTVNGSNTIITAADFSPVPGSGGNYVFCKKKLNAAMPTGSPSRFINSIGKFQLGFLNGATPSSYSGCRYGFFSDFKSGSVSSSQMEICTKDSAQLNAFGGITYQWSPASGISNTNIANPKVSPAVTTNYKVVINTAEGCIDSAFIKVVVNSLPTITKTNNTSICITGSIQLFASGGNTYVWTPANTLNNPLVANPIASPIFNTTYNVLVTDINNCSKTDSIKISIDTPLVKTIADTATCKGTPIQLSSTGAVSYTWSPVAGLSSASTGNPIATPTDTTQYIVTGTNANGCTAKDTVMVYIKSLPVISSSNDDTICTNQSVQILASGGTSYSWTPAATLSNAAIANPTASPTANTTYTVLVTGSNNCSDKDSIKISIRPLPSFSISGDKETCVNGNAQLAAAGGTTYFWSPGAYLNNANIPNPVATVPANTAFSVLINDSICNLSSTLYTNITTNLATPIITASKSNDIDCVFRSVQLNVTGANVYVWSPATSLSNSTISNPIASPAVTQQYTVVGTDSISNCKSQDTLTVFIKGATSPKSYIPNSFSPNGDGTNDCFRVRDFGTVKIVDIIIYNRYGNLVFQTKKPTECWDGTYKGQPADAGNYVYYIKVLNDCGEEIKKGNLLLLR